jgi:MvaI/BcnI restriction endonuclease family
LKVQRLRLPRAIKHALRRRNNTAMAARCLCEDTDFLCFLKAVADRKVYYDPGIKLEGASTGHPTVKRRSQFRIKSPDISMLYVRMESSFLV